MIPLFSLRCKKYFFYTQKRFVSCCLLCKQFTTYFLDWKGSNIDGISLMKDLLRNKEHYNNAHGCLFRPIQRQYNI